MAQQAESSQQIHLLVKQILENLDSHSSQHSPVAAADNQYGSSDDCLALSDVVGLVGHADVSSRQTTAAGRAAAVLGSESLTGGSFDSDDHEEVSPAPLRSIGSRTSPWKSVRRNSLEQSLENSLKRSLEMSSPHDDMTCTTTVGPSDLAFTRGGVFKDSTDDEDIYTASTLSSPSVVGSSSHMLNTTTLDILKTLITDEELVDNRSNDRGYNNACSSPTKVGGVTSPLEMSDMAALSNLLRRLQFNMSGVEESPSSSGTVLAATGKEIEDWSWDRRADRLPSENNSSSSSSVVFFPDGSLNLELFKVYPCKNESHIHDRKNCPFYHTQRDRRRLPATYRAEQCDDSFDLEDDLSCTCPQGEQCEKCHNRHELLYHPGIYKQRFCSSYNHVLQRSVQCHRGRFCAFAHSRDEIRCQLFTPASEKGPDSQFFMMNFKTLWCPYGIQHDWHGCLYAHTYQDCRRSPLIGYGSEPCPYWQKDLHSADYKRRCPYGTQCPYSHGSKEQLYHPGYYKTMPCADFKVQRTCPRGNLCAFYHEAAEKRPAGNTCFEDEDLPTPVYDYGQRLAAPLMACLQRNFMNPPLFNLDDFEAFGHGSRVDHYRRCDSVAMSSHFRGSRLGWPTDRPYWVAESPRQNPKQMMRRQQQQQQQQQQHQNSNNDTRAYDSSDFNYFSFGKGRYQNEFNNGGSRDGGDSARHFHHGNYSNNSPSMDTISSFCGVTHPDYQHPRNSHHHHHHHAAAHGAAASGYTTRGDSPSASSSFGNNRLAMVMSGGDGGFDLHTNELPANGS